MNKEKLKKQVSLLKESEKLYEERDRKSIQLHALHQKKNSHAIEKLKQEIRVLDQILDEITPEEEINQKELLEKIIQQILHEEPSSYPTYQIIKEKEQALKMSYSSRQPLATLIQKYRQIFERAAAHLVQSKRRPFLASLFGRHPKVLLSYEIALLAKEGKTDLSILRSLPTNSLQREFLTLLEKIVEEANKRWNHALYERAFFAFVEKSRQIHDQLQRQLEEERHETQLLSKEKEAWIHFWLN